MSKTNKRVNSDDDEDWDPRGKRKKKVNKTKDTHAMETCFIHCTASNENLTKLPSLESWEKLLKSAHIRQDQKVLDLEASFIADETEYPVIYYHLKCRNTYTHWKILNTISKVSTKVLHLKCLINHLN